MPPAKRKTEAPAAAAEKSSAAVFQLEQVIAPPANLPGSDTAAVLAAQQAGHVIAGEAYVERTEDVVGGVLVVWAVPVEAA